MKRKDLFYNVPCWALPCLQYDAEYNIGDSEFNIARNWQKSVVSQLKKEYGQDAFVTFIWADDENGAFFCDAPAFGEPCLCMKSKVSVRYNN